MSKIQLNNATDSAFIKENQALLVGRTCEDYSQTPLEKVKLTLGL